LALELAFGILYALFLELTAVGRLLAVRFTWLSVVVGVGATVLIAQPLLGWERTGLLLAAFACSGVGVVIRALVRDAREWEEVLRGDEE
jgi:hypothetical protein